MRPTIDKKTQHLPTNFRRALLKKTILLATAMLFATYTAWATDDVSSNSGLDNTSLSNATSPPAATGVINTTPAQQPIIIPSAPTLSAQTYVLMDYNTGQILAQKGMNDRRAPASLTKLMTLYVVFNALQSGQITLNDNVHISDNASKTGGSRMFINSGSYVALADLIRGVIVDSGNDATVSLAEYIASTADQFVPLMNQEAQTLGMTNTHFADVDGLPQDDHYSTAYDLALLARAIIKNFPDQYHFFSDKTFTWNGIKQANRNWLLLRDPSVDGLKTGDTDAAGYCLIASAQRNGMRLISVVMGSATEVGRIDDSQRLINYGYRFFTTHKLYDANEPVTQARVWGGVEKQVGLGLSSPLYLVIPKGEHKNLALNITLNSTLEAPIRQGTAYGTLAIRLNGRVLAERPLIALANDAKGGFWTQLSDYISSKFQGLFNRKQTQA